jgi:hypothetical protein
MSSEVADAMRSSRHLALGEMLQSKDAEKSKKVMEAMLRMEKIDIEGLKQAYEQQ